MQDVIAASGFVVGNSPTHLRDKLHPFNLQLSGEHACVFVRLYWPHRTICCNIESVLEIVWKKYHPAVVWWFPRAVSAVLDIQN